MLIRNINELPPGDLLLWDPFVSCYRERYCEILCFS